jgi:sporulation protein YlmC with PRC-barrel domain
MLLLSETLLNQSILSLRTGSQIAQVFGFIINPDNFKVEGFYCHDRLSKQDLVLLYQDIRNIIGQGIIVNDHDVLSPPDILVRLQDILKINYLIIGKPVVTVSKVKVGKVKDFAIDSDTFYVQKIYVGQSIMKSFNSGQLSIDRSQINT